MKLRKIAIECLALAFAVFASTSICYASTQEKSLQAVVSKKPIATKKVKSSNVYKYNGNVFKISALPKPVGKEIQAEKAIQIGMKALEKQIGKKVKGLTIKVSLLQVGNLEKMFDSKSTAENQWSGRVVLSKNAVYEFRVSAISKESTIIKFAG